MGAVTPLLLLGLICGGLIVQPVVVTMAEDEEQRISGAQLQSSVERPCPGERVTFTCRISSPAHRWQVSVFGITRSLVPGDWGGVITEPPFQFNVTEVIPSTSITSTATVTATPGLNGTLVVCQDGLGMLSDQSSIINVRDPPTAPGTPSVSITIPGQQFMIAWNENPLKVGEGVDTYFLNISGPDDLCGNVNTLQRFGVSTLNYTCSGWTMPPAGQTYTFTVQAASCGGNLKGLESGPVTVSLKAPNPPTVTVTPLYNSSGDLLEIKTQAAEGSPVIIADEVDGSPTEYIFSYNGAPITLSTSSTSHCNCSLCQHTFRDINFQVQPYNVSVAARNVVGVSTASTPWTVDSTNNMFSVTVDVGDPEVTCQFLNGPVTSATCTIQYGTDPTYMNLPNTDSSSGINVNNVTVPLGIPLQGDTLYYYVASSRGVQMQGNFHTGCTVDDLGIVDTTPDERCTGLQNSAHFAGGVVCYSDTALGSVAVYICNSTHHLEGTKFRECHSSTNRGKWSGSVPQCVADLYQECEVASGGLNAGLLLSISISIFLVALSTGILLATFITYCCMRRRGKSSGKPQLPSSEGQKPVLLHNDREGHSRPVVMLEMKENIAYSHVEHCH